jgi:outer membrane protein TolC
MICRILLLFSLLLPTSLWAQSSDAITPQRAIELALSRNDELSYRRFEREISRARIDVQKRKFFPSFGLSFSQNDSVTYGTADSRVKKAALNINQLVFDGGDLSYQYKSLKRQLYLDDIETMTLKDTISLQVLDACTNLLKNETILEIQHSTQEVIQQQIAITKREERLGMATEIDLLELQTELGELKLSIASTIRNRQRQSFQLSRLLEVENDDLPTLSGTINKSYQGFVLAETSLERSIAEYTRIALTRNPDLIQSRFTLEDARESRRQACSGWIPSIGTKLELSMSGEEYPLHEFGYSLSVNFDFGIPAMPAQTGLTLGKSNPRERSLSATASARPLDELEAVLSKKSAGLELAQTYSSAEDQKRNLRFDIREALYDIKTQTETLKVHRERIYVLEKKIQILAKQVELGEATRIDLVSAQIELAEQRVSLLEAAVELYSLETSLLQTCGIRDIADTVDAIILKSSGDIDE